MAVFNDGSSTFYSRRWEGSEERSGLRTESDSAITARSSNVLSSSTDRFSFCYGVAGPGGRGLYIDGEVDYTGASTASGEAPDFQYDLTLGCSNSRGDLENFVKGSISFFAILSSAPSAELADLAEEVKA